MKTSVFIPAHISGFFEPFIDEDPLKSGSRGAGINLSLGVKTTVYIEESSQQLIETYIDDNKVESSLIEYCTKKLIEDKKIHIIVENKLDLPIAHGFGISAASALGTSLSIAKLLDIDPTTALSIAHIAEIKHRTGLGDVNACYHGGIEIREKPGIPGIIRRIPGRYKIVLCILPGELETSQILNDENKMKIIKRYGKICTDKLLRKPTIENFFSLSWLFARETKLITREIEDIIEEAWKYGMASMCMLGNSIFAIGDTIKLKEIFDTYGETVICEVYDKKIRFL